MVWFCHYYLDRNVLGGRWVRRRRHRQREKGVARQRKRSRSLGVFRSQCNLLRWN